jgi:streptogramin lyase
MVLRRKIIRNVIILATLAASLMLTSGLFGKGIVRSFAAGVTATDFSIPSGSDPWGTTFDSTGRMWVALPGCDPTPMCSPGTPPGKIAVYNPSTSHWDITYQLPTGFGQPFFLAIDAKGMVWFPMPMSNSIGMLNPTTQTFQQWSVPSAGSGPWDIAIDHAGKIWFTEHYSNQIGRFDPVTQTFKEYATPDASSQPYGIAVDGANNVWFTENNSAVALIGEYTAGGQMKEYKIRGTLDSNLTPHLIAVGPGGNIWWTEGFVGMVGELNVVQATPGTNNGVTEYSYPQLCSGCGDHTSGIGIDSNGLVWFDDSLQSIFGSISSANPQGSAVSYNTPTNSSHPHDGLQVDGQNRIWFDEEFIGKIAEAVQTGTVSSPTATLSPTPGTILAQDTFQRANQSLWGTASDGQLWGGDANSSSVFAVAGKTGQLANGSTSYNAVLGPTTTNAQVLFSGSMSSFSATATNIGAVLRWTDTNNWYKAYIDGANFIIQKKVNGSTTVLNKIPFAAQAGSSYSLRFSAVGSTLTAKVWPTANAEPTAWMLTATDSSFQSGRSGLRLLMQSKVTAQITAFTAMTQSSTSTVTPSATPSSTPGTTLAQDTFQRTNQSLWGTASDGQLWGGDANSASVFAIVGSAGQLANGNTSYNAVLGPTSINAQVLFSGSISSFNASTTNLGAVLRWTDTNNWYKAYIDGANLIIQKKVNGSATILTQTPFAAQAGTSYSLRFSAVGSTLTAKVWPTANAEPTAWMLTATDSSLQSGQCGLRMLVQNGAIAQITAFIAISQ